VHPATDPATPELAGDTPGPGDDSAEPLTAAQPVDLQEVLDPADPPPPGYECADGIDDADVHRED
jgi:hypothetical protein